MLEGSVVYIVFVPGLVEKERDFRRRGRKVLRYDRIKYLPTRKESLYVQESVRTFLANKG